MKPRLLLFTMIFQCVISHAQKNATTQTWLTGKVIYSLKDDFIGSNKLEFRANHTSEETFRSFNLSQDLTFLPDLFFELKGNARLFYDQENDTLRRTELRFTLGAQYEFIRVGRLIADDYLRVEWRQVYFNYSGLNGNSPRLRNRLRIRIALNKDKAYLDRTFYLQLSHDWFFIQDEELKERFANRHRLEFGLGYKLDNSWKFVSSYYLQLSRNQVEQPFDNQQNIFQLQCVYTIQK